MDEVLQKPGDLSGKVLVTCSLPLDADRDNWVPVTGLVVFAVGSQPLRGIVSLAAAMALPDAFPDRDLIWFGNRRCCRFDPITFSVRYN